MAKYVKKADRPKPKKYYINPAFYGCKIGTIPPTTFVRKQGGVFLLDSRLTQQEMAYLYEVIGTEAIIYK
jgi:hypothetical protein